MKPINLRSKFFYTIFYPKKRRFLLLVLLSCVLLTSLSFIQDVEAKRRKRGKRKYSGPPPTHPVVLWAKTIAQSTSAEERKVAAFKLSQYSQPIFQPIAIETLLKCCKDPDIQIKVLCTKALGRAGNANSKDLIRKTLMEQYQAEEKLRSTIIRTWIVRKENHPAVQELILSAVKKELSSEETIVHLSYLEEFGADPQKLAEILIALQKKQEEDLRIHRAIAKTLAAQATSVESAVHFLAECAQNKDTPLSLICLTGLQSQGKNAKTWLAVENTIESNDPDVLEATLDVIISLTEKSNPKITKRLLEIVKDTEDSSIQEKTILALGVCGDLSEEIAQTLPSFLTDPEKEESVRIATALILGKQSNEDASNIRETYTKCLNTEKSTSLKTACRIGFQDLEGKKKKTTTNIPNKR